MKLYIRLQYMIHAKYIFTKKIKKKLIQTIIIDTGMI